jgi:hypothetical protein
MSSASKPRRTFLIRVATASGAAVLASHANAQPMVAENDPQATGLGYKADASKVDKAKFPKYAAGQECSNCAVYTGKAGEAAGACAIFPGKQVAAKGWCSAWVKKG